ncbi:MAG: MIP family channel protein [Candidatus Hydrogenedentes bacterium]|nr:MIP family channel protein [Candidatus Hydrogenedentota bacterium]
MARCCVSECFGTFVLVFAGTGAVISNNVSGGAVTLPGIAFTFGLAVMAMVYALGDASGAHINPAVSIAFWLGGRMEAARAGAYVVSQCAGAILASLLLKYLFPPDAFLGATLPSGSALQSAVLEGVLTLMLMFVILSVCTGAKEKGITAAIAIGGVVALDILFGGPISGASMNPARSLGPALVSGHLEHFWVYWAGPIVGACAAVPLFRYVHAAICGT